MAELQRLIQAKGTETSDLMKMYLSEAQHSFREHAKTSQGKFSSSSPININPSLAPNFLSNSTNNSLTNDNNGNNNNFNSNTAISQHNQQIASDINLNVRPSSGGNMNLLTGASEFNVGSPSSTSLHAQSPFLDMSELSPLPAGLNLNMGGFDNMCLPPSSGNLNGNSAYSPSNTSLPDNMANSPLIMPNLDNLEPCSPSQFFTGNMSTATPHAPLSNASSPPDLAHSPRNMNILHSPHHNVGTTGTSLSGASVCPPNLDNLKINTNIGSGVNANLNQQHPLLSPGSIKQEPIDTTRIKSEPLSDPPSCPNLTDPQVEFVTSQNRLSDVDRVLAEAQMTPEESRLLLLNQVTDIIVEAHMGTTINTYANVAAAKERIAGCKLDPDDMIPDLSKLSLSASDLWQQFLTALVPEITKVVKFSKKLPAFSDFPQPDQIKLIKQGAFEVMVARYSILVDEVNDLMLDPKLEMLSPRSVIGDMPMGPFLDEFFVIAKQFNPLCLTDGEISLFTAILMICPDREGLENREAISRIQDLILQALYLLMKQNTTRKTDAETTFRSLIGMIGQFRKVNDDHFRFLNNIKMKSPSEFNQQFPALHQEVFDETAKKSQTVE